MIKKIKHIKNTIKEDYSSLIGDLSFSMIMSLPPLLLITSYILSKTNLLTFFLEEGNFLIPSDLKGSFYDFFEPQKLQSGGIILIIIAIIISSNAFNSLIKLSNKIYGLEQQTNLKTRIKSFVFVPILFIVVFTNFILIALSDLIFGLISKVIYYEEIVTYFSMFQKLLKIPLSFLIIFIGVSILFKFLPNIKYITHKVFLGSLATTVAFIVISNIFSIYLNNFARYDVFYGNISNLIVLMIWINLLSYSVVLGLIINAKIYKKGLVE